MPWYDPLTWFRRFRQQVPPPPASVDNSKWSHLLHMAESDEGGVSRLANRCPEQIIRCDLPAELPLQRFDPINIQLGVLKDPCSSCKRDHIPARLFEPEGVASMNPPVGWTPDFTEPRLDLFSAAEHSSQIWGFQYD
jgi:hypothetical protein